MTPKEFVRGFYLEREALIDLYFNSKKQTDVTDLISSLQLDIEKKEILRKVLKATLRDAFYTVLLGLDGEANIGGWQETFKITDQEGNEISGGDIETFAWEYFHNEKFETEEG